MSETQKVQCPKCGEIVDESEIVVSEFPEEFEEVDVSDLDDGLPERFRGTGAVRAYARAVHVQTMCRKCTLASVN